MTTFDPDAGVLRVRHAALAVLALLATEPVSPRLHDHAVAEPLAELRAAGLVGAQGIDPAVAPLAHAIGAARRSADIVASDHGAIHRARLWIGPEAPVPQAPVPQAPLHDPGGASDEADGGAARQGAAGGGGGAAELAVVGLALPEDPETYALMADVPAQAPALLAELLGLGVAPPPPAEGQARVDADAFAALVAADEAVTLEDVHAAAGEGALARALTDGLRGAGLRWRLTVAEGPELWVLDAGASGLWLARREAGADTVSVGAVTGIEARHALAEALDA